MDTMTYTSSSVINSRSDYLIISRCANKILNFRVTHFLSYANDLAYRGRSND
jgi:hypothetical protein